MNTLTAEKRDLKTKAKKLRKEGSECKEGKSFENVISEAKCIIGPVVF